jgi:hypothetical protein
MKLVVALALTGGLACQGTTGKIEGHRTMTAGKDPGPAPQGEYEPGEPDAGAPGSPGPVAVEADGGGVPGEIALDQLAWRTAQLTCRRRHECCPATAGSDSPDFLDVCAQDLAEVLAPFIEGLARAVAGGRAGYDGIAAASCLAELESGDCAAASTWEPLLLAAHCPIVTAAVPPGEDCRASYECQDGFCQGGGDPTRLGRCVSPKLADGQPCDRGDDCASGTCHPALDVCAPEQPSKLCGS